METNLLEKQQIFTVLRIVAEKPGLTTYGIASDGKPPTKDGRASRDRTRDLRIADLTDAGLIERRADTFKGSPCSRYYLTQKGEMLMSIVAMIEKL